MLLVTFGVLVLVLTGVAFLALLPRGGKVHRWANTELEPYISVAICAGVALGFTMVLSGVINLMGSS
ncbi:MAG TPA: hypothetical protein VNL39_10675 [Xanthobacteraceae bacterium]|nr:hypothetical protein [Xanthobacteraceae bacterium]